MTKSSTGRWVEKIKIKCEITSFVCIDLINTREKANYFKFIGASEVNQFIAISKQHLITIVHQCVVTSALENQSDNRMKRQIVHVPILSIDSDSDDKML